MHSPALTAPHRHRRSVSPPRRAVGRVDHRDLRVIGGLYVAVVALMLLAFQVFTTGRTALLFISFAGALLLGIVGPVVYTVRVRRRSLASLGIGTQHWRATVALGLALAGVQFAFTLWGYDLPPDAEDWVPLLIMALVVGLFEAVFFRGFIQSRLEASFGLVPSVVGAAGLYALYHVGYGMGAGEMLFLFGLGIGYGIAFRLVRNVLVLWPLLIPMGSFFNNVQAGDIELPWSSIMGFGDVLAAMLAVLVIAWRHDRRASRAHGRETNA